MSKFIILSVAVIIAAAQGHRDSQKNVGHHGHWQYFRSSLEGLGINLIHRDGAHEHAAEAPLGEVAHDASQRVDLRRGSDGVKAADVYVETQLRPLGHPQSLGRGDLDAEGGGEEEEGGLAAEARGGGAAARRAAEEHHGDTGGADAQ